MNTRDPSTDALSLSHPSHELCRHDAEAMDALFEAGFDPAKVSADLRARAEKCMSVLGLLGCGPVPACDQSLVDATLVRVAWSRRAEDVADLMTRDEDALEALVAAGYDVSKCPAGLRDRAYTHATTLSMLNVHVADADRSALISRTLSSVQSSIDGGQKRFAMTPETTVRGGFRWSDLISVAALLLIASAVIAPMVGMVRGMSQKTGCEAGLASALKGFQSYSNDYRESLPLASASMAGSNWWNIGRPEQSNSANLFTLLRAKYATSGDLACPGNAMACRDNPAPGAMDWKCSDAISYSYRNQFTSERVNWTTPMDVVVLADRSPVMVRAIRGEWINPLANSDNHAGRGQNVMLNNGSVRWMSTPVMRGGDNIWLPRTLEEAFAKLQNPTLAEPLHGNETSVGKTDVFLTP